AGMSMAPRSRSPPRARGDHAGLELDPPGRADAAVLAGDPFDGEGGRRSGEAGITTLVHRRRPGVRCRPGEVEPEALDARASGDRRAALAGRVEDRALLDVE